MKRLRTYLVAGLLIWVPLGVTVFLFKVLVDLMDRTLVLIPLQYRPETLIGFSIPGLGILLTVVVLLVTGVFAANFFGRRLVALWESILTRIPLVRSVYGAAKNFAEIVLTDGTDSFKQALLIEYPRKGLYSLAFQTSTNLGEIRNRVGREVVCVFIPTTPNPTSGLILMVPRDDVIVLDMEVEAALKMVVSLGVVVPPWHEDEIPPPIAQSKSSP